VLGAIGKIDIEDDDVLAAALRKAGLQRLAEAEIPRVVKDADAVELDGELGRDRAGLVSAAVVDDDDLEAEARVQRLQVFEQFDHVRAQDGRFLVGG